MHKYYKEKVWHTSPLTRYFKLHRLRIFFINQCLVEYKICCVSFNAFSLIDLISNVLRQLKIHRCMMLKCIYYSWHSFTQQMWFSKCENAEMIFNVIWLKKGDNDDDEVWIKLHPNEFFSLFLNNIELIWSAPHFTHQMLNFIKTQGCATLIKLIF